MVKADRIELSPSAPKAETQPLRYTKLAGTRRIERLGNRFGDDPDTVPD